MTTVNRIDHQVAVINHIIFGITRPFVHVGTVEQDLVAFFLLLIAQHKRLGARQLLDVQVAVRYIGAVRLQLYLLFGEDRQVAVPVVFQDGVIGYQLPVEIYCYTVSFHDDAEMVPFADSVVCQFQRLAFMLLVVVQPAGANLCAHINTGGVPYLHLRRTAEVNTGVAFFGDLPVDQHFKVAVFFFRAKVIAMTVEHQQPISYRPAAAHVFISFLLCLGEGFGIHLSAGNRVFH